MKSLIYVGAPYGSPYCFRLIPTLDGCSVNDLEYIHPREIDLALGPARTKPVGYQNVKAFT